MFAMTTPNSESHSRVPQSVIIVWLLKIICPYSSVSDELLWAMFVSVASPLRKEGKHQCEVKGGNESPQFRYFGMAAVQFFHQHFRNVKMDTHCQLLVILVYCTNSLQHLYLIFLSVVTMQWYHMAGAHMVLSKRKRPVISLCCGWRVIYNW